MGTAKQHHTSMTLMSMCLFSCPAGGNAGGVDPEVTSAMIAKEQHKLEVLKRRQEREIQQVSAVLVLPACPAFVLS